MRKVRILEALLPKTRQGILAATFTQPEKAWYVSELARRMGVPASSLQRELRDLAAAGLLRSHRQGRMVYYQANADSPVFPDLRGLLLKTAGLVDVLADALRPVSSKIQFAFVFGSTASGNEQSKSDVDLMVVGTIPSMDLARPLLRACELIGREINPIVYRPAEFEKKRMEKNHFLKHVLSSPKLMVLGDRDELGSAGKRRLRRSHDA